MRDIFQLICKVVGLGFVCGGFVMAVNTIPLLFTEYPGDARLQQLWGPMWAALQQNEEFRQAMQSARVDSWRYPLISLVCKAILPALLGIYLMRSNNVFVRLCYPTRSAPRATPDRTSGAGEASRPLEGESEVDSEDSDLKFAPPAYRDS